MTGDSLYLGFILATIVLMLIPGPKVALIVIASIAQGIRWAWRGCSAPSPAGLSCFAGLPWCS